MGPTITVTLDKTVYAPGDLMTATVAYTVPEDSRVEVSALLRFMGGEMHSPPGIAVIAVVTAMDATRTWTLKSDDGAVAIFTARA